MTNTMTLQDWLDGFAEARPDAEVLYMFSDWCEENELRDWPKAMRWMADNGRWPWQGSGDGWRFWSESEFHHKTEDLLPDEFFRYVTDWDESWSSMRRCLQWFVKQYARISRESPHLLQFYQGQTT